MIDHGFCFNACDGNFPDAPLRGPYPGPRVYESIRGTKAFDQWLARFERIPVDDLDRAYRKITPAWNDNDREAIERMVEQLLVRSKLVPELIFSTWKSSAQPFVNSRQTWLDSTGRRN